MYADRPTVIKTGDYISAEAIHNPERFEILDSRGRPVIWLIGQEMPPGGEWAAGDLTIRRVEQTQ